MPSEKKPIQVIVDADLHKVFLATCESMDTTASREIRRFMKDFVRKNQQGSLLK